jgi:hypothetical protein
MVQSIGDRATKLSRCDKNFEASTMLSYIYLILKIIVCRWLALLVVTFLFFSLATAHAADLIVVCNITQTDRDAEQYSFRTRFEFFFEVNRYRYSVNRGSGWGPVIAAQEFVRADDDRIVLMEYGPQSGLIDEEIDRRTGAYTMVWHTTNGSIAETGHGSCAKFGTTGGVF